MSILSLMSSLTEIEAAVDKLPDDQKQELLLFLASRLRGKPGQLPMPRHFTPEQMAAWIAEDEADLRRISARDPS